MKKLFFLLILVFVFSCGKLQAITNVCNWSPVTTYTNGSIISGATVTYIVYRSTKQNLSNPVVIGTTSSTVLEDNTAKIRTNYYYYCVAYITLNNKSLKSNVAFIRK